MSGPPATIYSAEQIVIPPELPEILKNYAKYIIKQQPKDIIIASSEYFGRLSTQTKQLQGGKLSKQQLLTFYKKFSISKPNVTKLDIQEGCEWADVPLHQVADTLTVGDWTGDSAPWINFWALLCASVAGNLLATLLLIIELVSEGGQVNLTLVRTAFEFLSSKDSEVSDEIISNIGISVSSTNGSVVSSDALIASITQSFTAKPVVTNEVVESEVTEDVEMTEEQPVVDGNEPPTE
ncbi:hypothetical protein BC833DRAFT_582116 [Globomyces pollinis-pini]|nr:hypothetical protein BC833DRAFT_582116 [Globomyces pollinis-pini]KAJ3001008.1 Ropporin-1-like protein [Globomyces sp. JEL0801]KAJ3001027.1 Ropporin-1-like protein [Globomyces sp. JEL0801]